MDTELAFAASMAARDHAAFASFLADDAVFLNGGRGELRGKGRDHRVLEALLQRAASAVLVGGPIASRCSIRVARLFHRGVAAPDGQGVRALLFHLAREASDAWRIVFDDGCNVAQCT